jgi:lysophospholipase L1-like esterase
VKLRLAIAAVVFSVFTGGIFGLENVERSTQVEVNAISYVPGMNNPSDEVWAREGWYTNYSNWLWQGTGPLLPLNQLSDTHSSPERIRVVVLGDSVVWGTGLQDFNERWPNRLQVELDNAVGDGVFEVIPVAMMGASTMEQAEILEENIQLLDPDLIVLGLFHNDSIPSGREKSVCKQPTGCATDSPVLLPRYQDCVGGDGDIFSRMLGLLAKRYPNFAFSTLERYCDLDRFAAEYGFVSQNEIYEQPTKSPYRELFLESVQKLRKTAGDTPFLVYPTSVMPIDHTWNLRLLRSFTEAGFLPVEVDKQFLAGNERIHISKSPHDLIANPADYHPGPYMTHNIAKVVSRAVIATVAEGTLSSLRTRNTEPERVLINGYLPVALDIVDNSTKEATVVIPEAAELPADSPFLVRTKSPIKNQNAPCAVLGQPHARVGLNPALVRNGTMTVTLVTGPDVEVYAAPHLDNGNREIVRVGAVKAGRSVQLDLGSGEVSALLVAEPGRSCSTYDPLILSPRTLRLTLS